MLVKWIVGWIRRHPFISGGFSFLVIFLPQWVSSTWSLFSSDPIVPWLIAHDLPHPRFSPWFITIPVGVLMFATVILIQFKVPYLSKRKQRELQQRHQEAISVPLPDIVKRPIGFSSADEPHPRIVALDALKELLREGDKALQDFQFGQWEQHPSEKVDEYIARVRQCARRTVLEVPNGDWIRFEEPWEDMDKLYSEADALCQANRLPDILINPEPSGVFFKLAGRVERLRELLKALTGVKIESGYVAAGPASYNPKRTAPEVGPRNVPPATEAQRHEAWEKDQAERRISIHLPRRPMPREISLDRTPIEIVADLISDAAELEESCSDFSQGCKQRVESFTESARSQLRKCAPDYVAAFNDAVTDPCPEDMFPRLGRTVGELTKWLEDKDRQEAWRTISACHARLKKIHGSLRSKLPL